MNTNTTPSGADALQARAARYGAQPAAGAEPVAWVAADTLNSPHPTCVSSLAYMSQLDKDRGREYVPLYAAPVAAQPAASAEHATCNLQLATQEPVACAFFTEKGEVAYTGIYDRTLKALERVKTTRMGISSGSIDLYAAPVAAPAAPAAQQPLTDEHKAILKECRNQAMRWTLAARIPEVGAFSGIAQDLDYLCEQLGIKND